MTGLTVSAAGLPITHRMTYTMPVRLEVLDANLETVYSQWSALNESSEIQLDAGYYIVRAHLPSGDTVEETLKIDTGEHPQVSLDVSKLSPHETQAWAYLSKNQGSQSADSLNSSRYTGAWLRLWQKSGEEWITLPVTFEPQSNWSADGVTYEFSSQSGPLFMQVGGPEIPWKLIALPGAQDLLLLVRPAPGPADAVHPLSVTASSTDVNAESMLSFLVTGATDEAKGFADAGRAEDLLYAKVRDPSSAAVGGYYLLRVGELERLHDWTANLANWIDWMADGPIIRAWHILKEKRFKQDRDRADIKAEVRELFLQALRRGVPTYTEGLRLLRDGLMMLDQEARGEDPEVRAARATVDAYAAAADWSAPTTTFLGTSPAEPSAQPVTGKPQTLENLAFLFNVDAAELLRQGAVLPGTKLRLTRAQGEDIVASVSDDGRIEVGADSFSSTGNAAQEIIGQEAAAWADWSFEDTGESLSMRIDSLRNGKLTHF